MNDWVELTAAELVYLTDADPRAFNILDRVAVVGEWLRDAQLREEGEARFGRRLDRDATTSVEGWALVTAAARQLASAQQGSSLLVRGAAEELILIITPDAQVAITPQRLGIRLVDASTTPVELAAEVETSGNYVSGVSVRWLGGEQVDTLAWTVNDILVDPHQAPRRSDAPLVELCAFALAASNPTDL